MRPTLIPPLGWLVGITNVLTGSTLSVKPQSLYSRYPYRHMQTRTLPSQLLRKSYQMLQPSCSHKFSAHVTVALWILGRTDAANIRPSACDTSLPSFPIL